MSEIDDSVLAWNNDFIRTAAAMLVCALTVWGWVYVIVNEPLRESLGDQPLVWWFEQFILVAQAAVLAAILFQSRRAVLPAIILSSCAFLYLLAAALLNAVAGATWLDYTMVLNAILLWRLIRTYVQMKAVGARVPTA